MNNRGQTLVLFVLIIPMIFMIFISVIDIGKMVVLRSSLNNINYIAIDYGLNHILDGELEDELYDIILKNMSDIDDVDITISDMKIKITLRDNVDLLFFDDVFLFYVESSYLGYMDGDKKIIERDR